MQAPIEAYSPSSQLQAIAALNMSSNVKTAREVIRLALKGAERPVLTTKFGPRSAVLLHLVAKERPGIPVIWVDSGHNTKATLEAAAALQARLDIDLRVYRPQDPWIGWVPSPGEPDHQAFVKTVKLDPFARSLDDLCPDVWFSALRRSQTEHRSTQNHFNVSSANILKVHPLLHWSREDMDTYLDRHALPGGHDYHDPTKAGPRLECGMHLKF
jgi:phosphoadenosine phosphosulfate reductase